MWIVRHTSTKLTIWRTFGLSDSYLKALRAIFMISLFVFVTGQLRAINCSRAEARGPVNCEVTTGTILWTTTQSLIDVRDVYVKRGSKSDIAVVIHADGETPLGGLDYERVASSVSKFLYDTASPSFALVDDLRWLAWIGDGICGAIALIGLIYSLFGDALVSIAFDKRADTITLTQQFWLGHKQVSQRTLSRATHVSVRQRRGMPYPQPTLQFGKDRCLPLCETLQAKQMVDRMREFLALPTTTAVRIAKQKQAID